MDIHSLHEQNRRGWNEGAEEYEKDLPQWIEFLRAGGANFCRSEEPYLARLLPCERAIHLQCAGGTDTLSLWNRGAREVVGVDISDRMIEVARRKAEAIGANAHWLRSDVLETPHELDGTADLVYTGRGALCWIMDLEAWAGVVARLLKPGGHLYVFEGHPFCWIWDLSASELRLDPVYGDYFASGVMTESGWPTQYIDLGKPAEEHEVKHERQWNLGQVVNACIGAGLMIERLEEHAEPFWDQFPNLSEDVQRRIPQTFSLLARRDAA